MIDNNELMRKAFTPKPENFTLIEQIVSVTQIAHKIVALSDRLIGREGETIRAYQEARYLMRLLRQSRQIQMAMTAVPELKSAEQRLEQATLTLPEEALVGERAPLYLADAQARLKALID
ncbi:hypothetical protein [Ferrimonas balearica]|uniref:hypothetical protein n=1 Tax=Ferrimonas balearica TaxID=44012 RepID=UPI001C9A24CE|nr:hypothetical protein [Ferrimonas balearica]MBY5991943.1 hypothetical protein [Ferrimonas balearica]